ncbi:uncharacterized protein LOC130386429 [Gadus chalcogrammus]|uniref:uncharacterized protein LOC130386429 n=1 Tax=Gadus chalcogrammus TaxID=1042646 RepID=UPI0024C4C46D|nr:uncharacterized protein LOC130386429 [Gadus chalcogrammus]
MADFTWYVLSFTSLCCVFVLVQAQDPPVYIYKRVGDSVTLQCNNVIKGYQRCSSVTWVYGRDSSGTVELVTKGGLRQDNLSGTKASRLSLRPQCFLNISDINVGDAGLYSCQQYDSHSMFGVDETIYLSVLSGITQEDDFICSVHSYDGACGGVSLRWSDQGTSDQMSQQETPGQCVARRPNTQPLDSAGLRCLLMKDGVEKTSVDFASKDQNIHSQTNIPSGAPGDARRAQETSRAPQCVQKTPTRWGPRGRGSPPNACPTTRVSRTGGLLYASIEHRTGSGKARPPSVEEGGCEGDDTATYSTVSKTPTNIPEHSCSR